MVIENKLKQQFADLFLKTDQRIEKLTQQQAENYAEQQKVNTTHTQQLGWVIETLQRLVDNQNNSSCSYPPLPFHGNGQS